LPESDLALLCACARAAGEIAVPYWRNAPQVREKAAGAGPVTEADIAVNDMLFDRLMAARPDYGWLSEESEDSAARLDREFIFIIDPIDGTRSFIAGEKTWAHSLAVARSGRIVAGVVYVPKLDKLYQASEGGGAWLNGTKIRAAGRKEIADATVLAARSNFDAQHWSDGAPPIKCHFRPSLAYRLALVAEGRFDAALTLRKTWEWDVAAGSLIAAEAGALVTDRCGARPVFNNRVPALCGMIVASRPVHDGLLAGLA